MINIKNGIMIASAILLFVTMTNLRPVIAQTEEDPDKLQTACNHGNEMACNALNGDPSSVQGDKICTTLHPSNEPPLPMCTKIAGGQ